MLWQNNANDDILGILIVVNVVDELHLEQEIVSFKIHLKKNKRSVCQLN